MDTEEKSLKDMLEETGNADMQDKLMKQYKSAPEFVVIREECKKRFGFLPEYHHDLMFIGYFMVDIFDFDKKFTKFYQSTLLTKTSKCIKMT